MISTAIYSSRSAAAVRASTGLRARKYCRPLSILLIAVSLLSLMATPSSAQQVHPTESQVKAAYLYNLGKFVGWKVDRFAGTDSLAICVLGQDPFGPVLDATVAGESINGHKIAVSRISKPQEISPCSVLFISASEETRLGAIVIAARRAGALTVSDMPHFVERGGIIGFVKQQDRIRFEVNRGAAEDSQLTLSSELLKVASKVINKGTAEK